MNLFVELSANLYDAFCGVMFVAIFCGIRNTRKWFLVSAIALVFAVSTFFTFHSAFSALHSLIITAILYGVSFFISNGKTVNKILAPIIFELLLLIINTVFLTAFCFFFDLDLDVLLTQSSSSRHFLIVFCKIVLTISLLIILKFTKFNSSINPASLVLYLASPLLSAFILYVFMKISLAYNLNEYAPLIIGGTVGLALINLCAIFLFELSNRNADAKRRLTLIENQAEIEKESYQRMLKTGEELRKLRHDIKNHLLYVRGIIESNEVKKAEEYIDRMESDLNQYEKYMVTGNRTIDYIIASKFSESTDITLVCTGVFPESKVIDELDLAVLFGNLLDNAIEAVKPQENKLIEIRLSMYNDYCNILISNHICESVLKNNPTLSTTKGKGSKHGFGLKSVRSIVDKYAGILDIYEEGSKFNIQISLPIVK